MSRFFVQKSAIKGKNIMVDGEEAHHILDVMRLKELDKVVTFDGTGMEYVGFIKEIKRKNLVIEIVETRTPSNKGSSKVTLIQAIPKKDKMDYIAEKATELGVFSIVPVATKRTIPDWDEAKRNANVERWRKIAQEASKQCGRSDIPEIDGIVDFTESVRGANKYDLALIAALSDEAVPIKDILRDFKGGRVAIAIGPEGDFTPDEIKLARESGFKLVSLGPRVLKSDTAGLAMLAILNYEFTK